MWYNGKAHLNIWVKIPENKNIQEVKNFELGNYCFHCVSSLYAWNRSIFLFQEHKTFYVLFFPDVKLFFLMDQ